MSILPVGSVTALALDTEPTRVWTRQAPAAAAVHELLDALGAPPLAPDVNDDEGQNSEDASDSNAEQANTDPADEAQSTGTSKTPRISLHLFLRQVLTL